MTQTKTSGVMLAFQNYLKMHGVTLPAPSPKDGTIPSGKHKGKTFSTVAKETAYCNWFRKLGSSELDKAPWMREFRTYLDSL